MLKLVSNLLYALRISQIYLGTNKASLTKNNYL